MRILGTEQNAWCERDVAATGLLIDGDDYYRAFYEAAGAARHSILVSGWQFDSDACLLRGAEAEAATLPVTVLGYLDALCRRTPELRVYMLAWDFHYVFALEREWMQSQRFNWTTHDRLQFLFDSAHPPGAAHHQKFAVIDGQISFLGGLDLCDHRWDDRHHRDPNPLRLSRGAEHKPFHDVQAYLSGADVGGALTELFVERWKKAGGPAIELAPAPPLSAVHVPRGAVPLEAGRVALSRTDPQGSPGAAPDRYEIRQLYLDAIAAAEQLIYIESQYFSSHEVGAALAARLQAPDRPALDVAIVINMHAETLKEEIAVGLAQAKVIADLRAAAVGTSHRLGIYYTVPATDDGREPARATYIHSKIMIVDDRLLTVGSANLTNRSMGLDTELNVSVETEASDDALATSIRTVRRSLLAEHLGVDDLEAHERAGLVATLNELAERAEGRLRVHPSPTPRERAVIEVIDPQALPFDPAAIEAHEQERSLFVDGLGALMRRLLKSE